MRAIDLFKAIIRWKQDPRLIRQSEFGSLVVISVSTFILYKVYIVKILFILMKDSVSSISFCGWILLDDWSIYYIKEINRYTNISYGVEVIDEILIDSERLFLWKLLR